MRPGLVLALAALAWVAACSGDLFHSTDWTGACAADGCAAGGEGGTGVGGAAGGDGGAGAAGAAGGQGDGGTGVGGDGGSGGGAGGGDPGCQTCSEAVMQGPRVAGESFCPMSADLYSAVQGCACVQNGCPMECLGNLCASAGASIECAMCVSGTCSAIADACAADTGM